MWHLFCFVYEGNFLVRFIFNLNGIILTKPKKWKRWQIFSLDLNKSHQKNWEKKKKKRTGYAGDPYMLTACDGMIERFII